MESRPLMLSLALALAACGSDGTTSVPVHDASTSDAAKRKDGAVEVPSDGLEAGAPDVVRDTGASFEADITACSLVRPYSVRDKACNACAEQRCCQEINGCLSLADCDDGYVNCILGCALESDGGQEGLLACKNLCQDQYPAGKVAYDRAIGCADSACQDECQ